MSGGIDDSDDDDGGYEAEDELGIEDLERECLVPLNLITDVPT